MSITSVFTVAAIQTRPRTSLRASVRKGLELTERATKADCDIVCLPEHWVPRITTEIINAFARVVENSGKHAVLGACYEKLGRKLSINSVLISPDGVIGRQAKVHLFATEKRKATAGKTYEVFKLGGIRIGIAVCYDIVFPEVARILAVKGADLMLVPSKIVAAGIGPWHLYLKLRCLENRLPIIGVNQADPPRYPGRSIAFSVRTKSSEIVETQTIAVADNREAVWKIEINAASAAPLRMKRLRDRRPETYDEIIKAQKFLEKSR